MFPCPICKAVVPQTLLLTLIQDKNEKKIIASFHLTVSQHTNSLLTVFQFPE